MSRKDDVEFCKIAISQGLVTEDAARKALSLCDKREKDDGRRPLIGAVFTKYNLMQGPEVQRVYAAVSKRLGRQVGPNLVMSRARTQKGKKGAPVLDRRGRPPRPVDPRTLWLGVGGLVVFVAIVVVMFVLVILPSSTPTETGGSSVAANGGAGGSSAPKAPGAPSGGAPSKSEGATPSPGATKGLPPDLELQIDEALAAARDMEDAEIRLNFLENKFEKPLRAKGFEPPARLTSAIEQARSDLKAGGGAGESPAPTPPPDTKPPAEEAKAAPEATAESPAPAEAPAAETKESAAGDDSLEGL